MPQQTRGIRIWLCVAAALVAASIADSLVEFASNRGVFGSGSFTDHSNQDVLPGLCAGLLLAAVYVALRARRILTRGFVMPSGMSRMLPFIFALQIVLLYTMETLEQCIVAGHALGGTIWLGGPPPASLTAHAAVCVLATLVLSRLTRALSQTAVTIVAYVVAAIGLAPRMRAVTYLRIAYRIDARRRALLLGPSGNRAPPQLAA